MRSEVEPCKVCYGMDTIEDPRTGVEEPYHCPACGGTGFATKEEDEDGE